MPKIKELQHPPYSRFQGYLKENGIQLKEVAKIINRTVSRVSQNNNGWTDYSHDEVLTICRELKIDENVFKPRI